MFTYDPISPVAMEISSETCLLCFDEFQVSFQKAACAQSALVPESGFNLVCMLIPECALFTSAFSFEKKVMDTRAKVFTLFTLWLAIFVQKSGMNEWKMNEKNISNNHSVTNQ